MNYRFYGNENIKTFIEETPYPGIHTPYDLYDALSEIWCAGTCAPRMRHNWTKENMTLGQCSITGFLCQDIFGGKVYGVLRPGGNYHCYNVIGEDLFDLTSEQFGDEILSYEDNPEQFREVHFAKEEKRLRYEYLKEELGKYCLIKQLESYKPFNEQEERDKANIITWIKTNKDAFLRSNEIAHITASAWVVSPDREKVLMVYHNIYDSWSWLGGHADGETNLLQVALKEVKEEAGLSNVTPVSEEIFSLESLTVDGHEKKGRYVGSHLHLNITYLLEADPKDPVFIKEDENSGVSWFTKEEALQKSTEPWFVDRVYKKLNLKQI